MIPLTSAYLCASEKWWRLEVRQYCAVDEFDNPYPTAPQINWMEFTVIRHTPKGVWLRFGAIEGFGFTRFVLKSARKRYACPTKAEAQESFVARKKRQLRILRGRINEIEHHLRLVESPLRLGSS